MTPFTKFSSSPSHIKGSVGLPKGLEKKICMYDDENPYQ